MGTSKLKSWKRKRDGEAKTCPTSRHAAMIANDLRSKKGIGKLLRDAGYDPEHMADSIEGAVVSLWNARKHLEWRGRRTSDGRIEGDWFPLNYDGELYPDYVEKMDA